jgi:bifunctional non-homologous end joining protein LigD
VRMRQRQEGDKEQWLIFKSGEDLPPISARAEDQSVLTKRSLEEIAAARDAEWESNRKASRKGNPRNEWAAPETNARRTASLTSHSATLPTAGRANGKHPSKTRARGKKTDRSSVSTAAAELDGSGAKLLRALPKGIARFVEPMKCLLVNRLPRGDDWTYEVKFDGFRALTVKQKTKVSLISRNAKDLTLRFPEIAEALQNLPCREATLDGEIVAVDPQGRSSFQMLQSYNTPGMDKPPIFYYAFDLLHLDGRDLTSLPLVQRKELLAKLVEPLPQQLLFSASLDAAPDHLLREMKARGLEGLIAKRKQSKYEIGQRNGSWVKFKWTNEQEFVIGGYTPPEGARTHFGALLVGYYEDGQLLFASKVGTGFNYTVLEELYEQFQKLIIPTCPFANLPEKIKGRYGQGMTAAEMKHCTWIKPAMVCQIRFTEWTRDNHLRHPAFLGLREDKKATEVVRENPK